MSEARSGDTDLEDTRVDAGSSASPRVVNASELPVGSTIGRYVLLGALGKGGMGEVLSAYDPELDRRVALKLVRFGGREGAREARSRLLREAQALAKLSHPNVVTVFDAGTHEDRVFIAMEHLEGITLRRWLKEHGVGGDSWRQALPLLIQAGRGLAAAHARGIVHRDFKPANVMISEDDRVRVLDFGLARRFDAESTEDGTWSSPGGDRVPPSVLESLDTSHRSLDAQLTQTGTVMGTPGYMAPEQFIGRTIDARTDQFAFCVVLFRALFGERPFAGKEFRDLGRSVVRGELREVPAGSRVPRAVHAVVRRGLSVGKEDRYPSMEALLEDLERALGQGRRRLIWAGAGGAALVTALGLRSLLSADPVCQGAETHLSGVWDDSQREAVGTAFRATELAFAEDSRERIVQALDAYSQRWIDTRTEVCEATRVQGDQSAALMDTRIRCLDAGLRDLGALTTVLGEADAAVVEHAVEAASRLPAPETCASQESFGEEMDDPRDPERAAEVDRVRDQLAQARALLLAGKLEPSTTLAEEALQRAQQTEHRPLIAEASIQRAAAYAKASKGDLSRDAFVDALVLAEACGHGRIEAEALLGLVFDHGYVRGEHELGLRYARHAEAVIGRIGSPVDLRGYALMHTGVTLMTAGRHDEAAAKLQEAIALSDEVGDYFAVQALTNLSAAQARRGALNEAVQASQEALRRSKASLGPLHPLVGTGENNLALAYMELGQLDAAEEHQKAALQLYSTIFGEDHFETIRSVQNLGSIQARRGDHEAALAAYQSAFERKRRVLGPDNPSVALAANNIGQAHIDLGRPLEGIPHFEEALRIWTKSLGEDHVTVIIGNIGIAQAHLANGTLQRAVPNVRRVLELLEGKELSPHERGEVLFVAAQVIAGGAGELAEGRALAQRAIADYRAGDRPSEAEIEEIERWLAEHPADDAMPDGDPTGGEATPQAPP